MRTSPQLLQAKDAADKLEKTQTSLKTFYNTLGKMADNFGRTYTGNREIGQELIRLTARYFLIPLGIIFQLALKEISIYDKKALLYPSLIRKNSS